MTTIAIQKVREVEALPRQIFEQLQFLSERIRQRAYDLFQTRGATEGHDLEDWLQAERELRPETELSEKDREFQARINVFGLEPKDISVIALPNSILLQGGNLFRRLEFPRPIDVDKVVAKFDRGILQVIAPKGQQEAIAA
jgi:HSP20 family molecular chaperone IbpA